MVRAIKNIPSHCTFTKSADRLPPFAFSGRAYLIKEHTHINTYSSYESWMLVSAKSVA